MTNKEKGQQMRKWRLAAGETIAKVAKDLGYSGAYLSQMENGRKNVGDKIFNAYKNRYNIIDGVYSIIEDHEKHVEAHRVFKEIPLPPVSEIDKIYEAVMESQKKMDEMHALLKSIFE